MMCPTQLQSFLVCLNLPNTMFQNWTAKVIKHLLVTNHSEYNMYQTMLVFLDYTTSFI